MITSESKKLDEIFTDCISGGTITDIFGFRGSGKTNMALQISLNLLKNEVEYKGKMKNVDSYMNLIMTDAEELTDGKTVGKFGRVILRGNNVLFIKLEDEI